VIAIGDGSQRALMESFQAGCDDYIDRHSTPVAIAAHVKQIIVSKAQGFFAPRKCWSNRTLASAAAWSTMIFPA